MAASITEGPACATPSVATEDVRRNKPINLNSDSRTSMNNSFALIRDLQRKNPYLKDKVKIMSGGPCQPRKVRVMALINLQDIDF